MQMMKMIRKEIEPLQKEAAKIKKEFDDCYRYKDDKRILKDAKVAVDFYEGRQWDSKKKLPFEKPVINVIQNMVDEKVASILNKSWKVNFIVSDDNTLTDKVNKFTEWQMSELDQDTMNYYNALNGLLKGSWFNYYYWNEDKEGQMGVNDGGVEVISIDIQDIAVANPKIKNIQKQDYIIVRSRESIKSVRELAVDLNDEEKKELIVKDNFNSIYSKDTEQDGEDYVDVYTKFFRDNGEVYFEKATQLVVFQRATSLNPLVNAKILKLNKETKDREDNIETQANNFVSSEEQSIYKTDAHSTLMKTDGFEAEEQVDEVPSAMEAEEPKYDIYSEERYKANQYPITMGVFIERDNCIFGLSWVAQLIAPQKNINQLLATTLLTATKWTMPQVVVKEGALGTQQLDMSKPGGIITDYSPQGTEGIKLLNYPTMPTSHYELSQSMITMLKDVYRTNDILNDGRNTSKGMSGYAMNLITSIQEKPIAQWQQKMARSIQAEGRILEMYYKLYYRNKRFTYRKTDAEIMAQQSQKPGEQIPTMHTEIFDGKEYLDTPFNVIVEVGESAKFNETSFVSLIETLFLNGTIEKLSPETLDMYVTMMPDTLFPKKGEFKLLIKQKEQGIINKQNEMINQQQQVIEQLKGQIKELGIREQMKEKEMQNVVEGYNYQLKRLYQQNDMNKLAVNNIAAYRQSQNKNVE